MTRGYGQYCPLALAAELLCERWTVLIVSRLLDDCSQFSQIHRGLPRISPSLLSQRLAQLIDAGIVEHASEQKGASRSYRLTAAGLELAPVVEHLAIWGQHWARDMIDDDLDPAFLVWSLHMRLDASKMPPGRTVIEFEFIGARWDCHRFWLVNDNGQIQMCLKDPGYQVNLKVRSDLRRFIEAWRGIRDLRMEIQAGKILLHGPSALKEQLTEWLLLSMLSPYPRKRAGREKRIHASKKRAVPSFGRRGHVKSAML
jgi:DNA-binding HxlR family transcriptional regulator